MQAKLKTMVVAGAPQGIGAGVTKALLERGYNVVANSLHIGTELQASQNLALVEGDIAKDDTAQQMQSPTEGARPTASAEQRLHTLGISLPQSPEPFGMYAEACKPGCKASVIVHGPRTFSGSPGGHQGFQGVVANGERESNHTD